MPHLSSTTQIVVVESALVLTCILLCEMGLQKVFQTNFSYVKAHTHGQVQ